MSQYVDGYVLPVSKDNIEEYREMASEAGKTWIKHGALQYFECIGDDLTPDLGEGVGMATFPDLVGVASDETVIFAFVIFESREHRDEVNAAVHAEMMENVEKDEIDMPFEVARMTYGGFKGLVEYQANPSTNEPIGTGS